MYVIQHVTKQMLIYTKNYPFQPLINEIHFNVEGSRFTCVSNFLYVFVTFQYFQMPEKITYFH
jgi:hypothetical protein